MSYITWKMTLKMVLFMSFLTTALAASVSTQHRYRRQMKLDLTTNVDVPCVMKSGETGICVPFYQSNGTHVLPGGYIDQSIARALSNSCPIGEWCSSLALVNEMEKEDRAVTVTEKTTVTPTVKTTVTPTEKTTVSATEKTAATTIKTSKEKDTSSSKCATLKSDICTWCVTLHKVLDKSRVNKEPFCLGSLISSNVILTAATCLIASEQYILFARVPASANKAKNYYAKSRFTNILYDSGTHFNDFGLITLEENVDWGTSVPSIACLGFEEVKGECLTFGIDKEDNIVSTLIDTVDGACKDAGGSGSLEVMCGTTKEKCFAAYGAPVVCQTKNTGEDGGELVGVVRSDCMDKDILLGKLMGSVQWLKSMFPHVNVDEKSISSV